MKRLEEISKLLLEEIEARFDKEPLEIGLDLEFSDSLPEMLEKFIILHIRTWKLEDAIGLAKTPQEIAELKIKIDFCFKNKRPKLIKAIGCFLDAHINKNHHKSFAEENVKLYK